VAKIWQTGRALHAISDLERLVCEHLNLIMHEVRTDQEVRELGRRYSMEEREYVFAALESQLDLQTFGVLIQRKQRSRGEPYRYVAVIDCRGEKAARRFFTRWHEIAHCLTTVDQFELPLRRTTIAGLQKDPVEKLMDMIAGELGFFDPLFVPLLTSEIQSHGRLTFASVEKIRSDFCPEASFQATLNACVDRASIPMVSLIVGLGLKAEEKRALEHPQFHLIPPPRVRRQLRALSSIRNDAARRTPFQIHRNMRIPSTSIIAKVYREEAVSHATVSRESLGDWGCSSGETLPVLDVEIQAKKIADQVFAIVSLVPTN
jgi:hypothetical protein